MKRLVLITFSISLLIAIPAHAGDISLHNFFQGNYSLGLERFNPDEGDFKWTEEKLQLKVNADRDPVYLFLKTDISYDHLYDEEGLEFREAYIDFLAESWDVRIDRQGSLC